MKKMFKELFKEFEGKGLRGKCINNGEVIEWNCKFRDVCDNLGVRLEDYNLMNLCELEVILDSDIFSLILDLNYEDLNLSMFKIVVSMERLNEIEEDLVKYSIWFSYCVVVYKNYCNGIWYC